jgi:hypothetical protein
LKKKTDPDVFITYLEDIQGCMSKMNSSMTDDQFILHVMNNLTKDYEMQILKLEEKIGYKFNALTIKNLRHELNLRFIRMNTKDDSDNDEDEEEKALFGSGQFKGRCTICGKYGHKSANFRSGGNKDKRKVEAAATVVATTATKVAPLSTQATMSKSKGTAGTATNLAMVAPTAEVPRRSMESKQTMLARTRRKRRTTITKMLSFFPQ